MIGADGLCKRPWDLAAGAAQALFNQQKNSTIIGSAAPLGLIYHPVAREALSFRWGRDKALYAAGDL